MKRVTSVLDVVGLLLLAVAAAVASGLGVAAATAPRWGVPAGLLVLGGAIMAVSWVVTYLVGPAPAADESEPE